MIHLEGTGRRDIFLQFQHQLDRLKRGLEFRVVLVSLIRLFSFFFSPVNFPVMAVRGPLSRLFRSALSSCCPQRRAHLSVAIVGAPFSKGQVRKEALRKKIHVKALNVVRWSRGDEFVEFVSFLEKERSGARTQSHQRRRTGGETGQPG